MIKDLLNSDSPTQRDFYLERRIGPPPPGDPPPEIPPGPPAKTGPTDEELKEWTKKAEDYLKDSAAKADEKIKTEDGELDRRTRGSRWRRGHAFRMEKVLGKDSDDPEVVRLRGELKQVEDRVNFGVDADLKPVPLTQVGRDQAAALRREVAELRTINDMSMADKLKSVFERAINATNTDGSSKLAKEVIDGLKEAIKPENLATMAAVMGVIGVSTFTPAGPIVMSAAAVFGYIMTGKSVIDIGEDVFQFIIIGARARRPQDFDKAADHLIAACKKLAEEAGGAAVGFGVGKVAKGVGNLKKVADAGGDPAKNMANRRADGKMQVNDGQPKAPPPQPQPQPGGGVPVQAAAAAVPVPLLGMLTRKHPKRPPPAGLTEDVAKIYDEMDAVLGPKAMDPFVAMATRDGYDLNQALPKLKSVLEKTLANNTPPPGQRDRQLFRWQHLASDAEKKIHLQDIFGNDELMKLVTLPRLLDDLEKVSHLPGYQTTFKRLTQKDSNVKGTVAEIQLAIKENADRLVTPFEPRTVTMSDGKPKLVQGTDADYVAAKTFWNAKIGKESIEGAGRPKIEAWLRTAAEEVKARRAKGDNSVTEVGLKVDAKAAEALNGQTYKDMLKDLARDYPDVKVNISVIVFPNP